MSKRLSSVASWALIGFIAALSFLLLASGPGAIGKPALERLVPHDIRIDAKPIALDPEQPDRRRFGKLQWLGSLELTSASPYFGGYSGLILGPEGKRLMAVSDAGTWLSAELRSGPDGPTGLSNPRTGPLIGKDGKPVTRNRDRDAEALAPAGSAGNVYIGYEQRHRIELTPWTEAGPGAPNRQIPIPKGALRAKGNSGIEGVTLLTAGPQAGSLLFFTETLHDSKGNHRGWLLGRGKAKPVSLKRLKGFDITGLALLPDGDLLVLERRFRFIEGVKMRIRRVKAADIKPGALLDGEVLIEADRRFAIDNMEGIAVHHGTDGQPVITLISDDNFNRGLQRTLLMQFALPRKRLGEAAPQEGPR